MTKLKNRNKQNRASDREAYGNDQVAQRQDERKSLSEQNKESDRYSYVKALLILALMALIGGTVDFLYQRNQASNAAGSNPTVTDYP